MHADGLEAIMSLSLPLWNSVIFVDWNGVLSIDPFWVTILQGRRHALHQVLQPAVARFFREHSEQVNLWMRGTLSYRDVIKSLDLQLESEFGYEFLETKLLEDCRQMRVNSSLMAILARLKSKAFVIIATDNMDCFYEETLRLRLIRRKRRPALKYMKLENVALFFDDVICSSDLGVLKRDAPQVFFGPWLSRHNLSFSNALLLDDGSANCEAFRAAGGAAIQIGKDERRTGFCALGSKIDLWLDGEAETRHKLQV